MKREGVIPRCTRCGYLLVGNPPPIRCPECGHQPRTHKHWIEGELHREGPDLVLGVLVRQFIASAALVAPLVLGVLLSPSTLEALDLTWKIDRRWCEMATCVGMVVATLMWTRPIRTRDADHFGLGVAGVWRRALPVLQLPWLVVAALLGLAMSQSSGLVKGSLSDETTMRWATILTIVAQVPWILSMRHVSALADYLRDARVRRSVATWQWVWIGGLVLLVGRIPLQMRYGNGFDLGSMLQSMAMLSRLGVIWGTVNAVMVAWVCVGSLTLAHEEVARDERRAEAERDRYRMPS